MTNLRSSALWAAISVGFCLTGGSAVAQPENEKPATRAATTRPAKPRLPPGFVSKKVKLPDGSERKYVVYVPPQYKLTLTRRWPLIVFLHGSRQCGTDGIRHTRVGLPSYIASRPTKFPFIVVFPQAHQMWFRGKEAAAVWATLDAVLNEYRVDRERMYLTGLSMGGFGTWELAATRPDVFAAIVPICGGGPLEYLSNIAHLPVWAFHGAADKNVPVQASRQSIAELRRLGADPYYTEYPGVGHKCWDQTYSSPKLWRWLLQQRRPPPPRVIDYRFPNGGARVWWLVAEADRSAKAPAHVRVELGDEGCVTIESTSVIGWVLLEGPPPLQKGKAIEVVWNGQPVYRGEFNGALSLRPTTATQP